MVFQVTALTQVLPRSLVDILRDDFPSGKTYISTAEKYVLNVLTLFTCTFYLI